MTKITIETKDGKASIEVVGDDLDLNALLDDLIIPALQGVGFSGVEEFFDETGEIR